MQEKVKFAKRIYNKDTGEHELAKPRTQARDFQATFHTLPELVKLVKRAQKRASKATGEKQDMYQTQAKAYEARIEWYLN